MKAREFFEMFYATVRNTEHWRAMANTVEGSEWHREANVAVHTDMCLEFYWTQMGWNRSERQKILTAMTLLFHDFGKPEAEETLERRDGSGSYHRYAGHESVSANEFVSFMCEHPNLTNSFFAQGYTWDDVRKMKFMIEHHLPYGLKNPTKRANLKAGVVNTLGTDEECFYDVLWADCNGRVSDDHRTKKNNVLEWVREFYDVVPAKTYVPKSGKVMYVLVGPVGVGKTTWTDAFMESNMNTRVVSEDDYRAVFAHQNMSEAERFDRTFLDMKAQYALDWQFCFDNSKEYEKFATEQLMRAVESGDTLILDRTNQTRKSRAKWITAARSKGYTVRSVEFYISEKEMHNRQQTRPDKLVPWNRAHQIYMNFDVPMVGVEVDSYEIVSPF